MTTGQCRVRLDDDPGPLSSSTRRRPQAIIESDSTMSPDNVESDSTMTPGHRRVGLDNVESNSTASVHRRVGLDNGATKSSTAWGHRRVGLDSGRRLWRVPTVVFDSTTPYWPLSTSTRRRPIIESDSTMARGFGACRPRFGLDGPLLATVDFDSTTPYSPIVEFSSTTVGWPLSCPTRQWSKALELAGYRLRLDSGQPALVETSSTNSTFGKRQGLWPSPDRVELSRWPATFESNSIESTSTDSSSIESTSIESNTIESNTIESNTMVSNTIAWTHDRIEHDCLDSRSPGLTFESNTIAWTPDRVEHDRQDSRSTRTRSSGTRSSRTRWSQTRSPELTIGSNTIVWTHDRLDSRSSQTRSPGLAIESNTIARTHDRVEHDRLDSRSSRTRSPGLTIDSNTIAWNHDRLDSRSPGVRFESETTVLNTTRTRASGLTVEFNSAAPQNMEGEGKASKRRASKNSGSMEQSPKKLKGTPAAGVWSQEAPGSKRQCTPVPRGAPSTGTPSTHVRGSGPDKAVLMTGGPAGQERMSGSQQGRSAVEVVPGCKPSGERRPSFERKASGETTAAGRRDDVPVIDHKNKFWMLDWVGETGQPSSGLVLYVVIKDNIVPVGGLVRWTGQNVSSATFELTMVLNGRGERIPNIKHVALRWANHAGFGKSLVDVFNPPGTLTVKLPNLVDVLGFLDSNVIAGREPVVHPEDRISEPKCVFLKTVETGSSITIPDTLPGPKARQIGEKGPYCGLVGQDEDNEHTMRELGGEVGLAGGYGSSYEGCEGDVHATVVVAGHTDVAGLAEGKRKHRRERKSPANTGD
ncbi:hypothetical protein CBR_g38023 [Chara braunii]|uniref:Uncharacterized protein n=1 Tax=Chara braunii TaxID=69332 RepID=A0A388K004_CHABU|nr:hypothetical protein CBR_g38023 [Chara braunii]|eukprot:GBG63400.1 hypothetical protein CBR_g38023 [Chara braunii]